MLRCIESPYSSSSLSFKSTSSGFWWRWHQKQRPISIYYPHAACPRVQNIRTPSTALPLPSWLPCTTWLSPCQNRTLRYDFQVQPESCAYSRCLQSLKSRNSLICDGKCRFALFLVTSPSQCLKKEKLCYILVASADKASPVALIPQPILFSYPTAPGNNHTSCFLAFIWAVPEHTSLTSFARSPPRTSFYPDLKYQSRKAHATAYGLDPLSGHFP